MFCLRASNVSVTIQFHFDLIVDARDVVVHVNGGLETNAVVTRVLRDQATDGFFRGYVDDLHRSILRTNARSDFLDTILANI